MINLNKKIISVISFATALTVAVSTIICAIAVTNSNDVIEPESNNNDNPLDRDNNYKKYNISQKIGKNELINEMVDSIIQDNNYIYVINEQKFITTMNKVIKDVLKNDINFSNNYNEFVIECSYKIITNLNIKIDLVWYLPNSQKKYYDQFDLLLTYY